MAQDTYDIEDSLNAQQEAEQDSYLHVDPAEAQVSSGAKSMEMVDNIVDVSSNDDYNVINAGAAVGNTYAKTDGEQVYTRARMANMWEAFDSGIEQTIQNAGTVAHPSDIVRTLQDGQSKLKEIETMPWAHEAGIELTSKGMVEFAPQEYAMRQISGLTQDSGLWQTIGDWAGIFFWPDLPKDQADFVGLVSGEFTFLPDGADGMKKIINAWSLMPADQQRAIFPELTRLALEATEGNAVKAQQLLYPFSETFSDAGVDFNTTLGYIDWALVGSWPATKLYQAGRTVSTINRIAKLRGKQEAAIVSNKVLGDPTGAMAEALRVPKETAVANAHPVNQSRVILDSTDDLAGEIGEINAKIENAQAKVRDTLSEIDANEWLQVKHLSETEMESFANSQARSLEEWAEGYYRNRGFIVEGAEPFNRTKDGFQVRITMRGMHGTDETIESPVLSYTLEGIPKATKDIKANPITTYLASPKVWLEAALSEGLVAEATVINFQQMRLNRIFNDALREVWSGLNKKQKKKVDAVLWQGQKEVGDKAGRSTDMGRVYTWKELDEGVDVSGELIQLTDAEKLSYFKARELFDSNHQMLNRMQRETLKSEGFMEATISGAARILRPYRMRSDVPVERAPKLAFDPAKGRDVTITKKMLDDKYEDGWILANLHDSSYIAGTVNGKASEISHVWIKPGNLKELRANPIRYIEGYVPRIYKNAPYVVEKSVKTTLDGQARNSKQVVRLFKSRKEAKEYADKQTAKSTRGSVYTPRHQSEVDAPTLRELILQEAGGLFVDDKGKHLKLGLDGDNLAEVYNASEALNRQLGFLAKNMPMNLWRQGVIRRWEEAAEKAASHSPRLAAEVKKAGFNVRTDVFGDKKVATALEKSREWIKDQLMLRTPQEKVWEGTMLRMAEWAEGLPAGTLAQRGLLWAGSKDPFSALRGASFHALLGVWNPAQLVIQAQGFAIAASIDGLNPVQVGMRMRQYMALRALGSAKEVNPEVLRKAAKAGGYTEAEMKAIHDDFRISGLLDSVRTNADLEMMKNGFPSDRGAWGRVLQSNLIFYKEGETFTRSYAFLVARDNFIKSEGLKASAKLTEDQLLTVVENATRKMLNLNRANRAQWQKGAFSVPTQFLQVTTKFIEDIVFGAGKFTGAERSKIMAWQLGLYGAAGMPFGVTAIEGIMDWAGVGPEDMNEEVVAGLRNGIGGMLTEMMFDESVAIGKRGAYISGVEQIVRDILSDQVDLSEMAAGASGHVLGRSAQAIAGIMPLIFRPSVKLNATEVELAVGELASVFSTFSNAHKAYLWWNWQRIVNKRGQIVMTAEEADNFTAIWLFKGLGFSAQSVEDVYEADKFTQGWQEYKTEIKNAMKEVSTQYLYKYSRGEVDEAAFRNMEAKWTVLLSGYPEHLREEIQRETWSEALDELSKSKRDINFQKAFKVYLETGDTQFGLGGIGLNSSIMKEEK